MPLTDDIYKIFITSINDWSGLGNTLGNGLSGLAFHL
jgi:hypothetical protein